MAAERLDVEKGDRIKAVEAVVVEMEIMNSNGSTALTLKTTQPHSPQQICRRWEMKDERAYSGGGIQLKIASKVVMTAEETITIEAGIAMTVEMTTTAAVRITGVKTVVTVKSSRPAATIRTIKGMIPQMIDPWSHITEVSQRMRTSLLHKDEEDMPEEALV